MASLFRTPGRKSNPLSVGRPGWEGFGHFHSRNTSRLAAGQLHNVQIIQNRKSKHAAVGRRYTVPNLASGKLWSVFNGVVKVQTWAEVEIGIYRNCNFFGFVVFGNRNSPYFTTVGSDHRFVIRGEIHSGQYS